MFMQVQETGYEVRFRVFGVPVMVHPFFWLVALILVGSGAAQSPDGQPILNVLGAVGVVFISILVHELGHSAAMAWYRIPSHIVLYAMGGMAIPLGSSRLGARGGMWDQIVISFAGPLAQFLLLGPLALFAAFVELPRNDVLSLTTLLYIAIFCNLFWPILNLLPVLPLDGGRICQGFTRMIQGSYQGDITALWISVICGAALAVLAFQFNFFIFAVFLIFMTIQNFQELQQGPRRW
jgi:stage IV sporulation protein FB